MYRLSLRSVHCTVILLWDFIDWEVRNIDVGRQLRFERRSDLSKVFPDHAAEEWMLPDR